MESTVTRRNFVKGAALGTVAAAGIAGVARADELPQQWDQEADFVVIGAGCTGISAAVEATELGMSALIVEKMSKDVCGGDSRCNAGLMYMQADDAETLIDNHGMGRLDEDYAWDIQDEAEECLQWLLDHGCKYKEGEDVEFAHFEGHGPSVYAALENGIDELGIPVLYETAASELIVNPATGETIGVYAEQDGTRIAVRANKAVMIATGSYTNNRELVYELNLLPGLDYYTTGAPYLTGDGLIMGLQVGASLWRMGAGLEYDILVSKPASEEIGSGVFAENPPRMSMFWVNSEGKRFYDETVSLTHNKSTALGVNEYDGAMTGFSGRDGFRNNRVWRIFDQACFESGSQGNATSEYSWARLCEPWGYVWSDDNQAELERGWIVQADTIEELAEKIGLDPEALAETTRKYNEGCETGEDEFGRTIILREDGKPASDSTLLPLGDGPYYAMELAWDIIYTIGGLRHDPDSRCIDWMDRPIARLYSGGNVGQGSYLLPIGVPGCMAQGRFAARHAAMLEPWS